MEGGRRIDGRAKIEHLGRATIRQWNGAEERAGL